MGSRKGQSQPLSRSVRAVVDEDAAEQVRVGLESFTQLSPEAVIEIWRRDPETREFAATSLKMSPDDFAGGGTDKIRDALGGGKFQARVRVPDAEGRWMNGGQRSFNIEGPAKLAGSGNGSGAGQSTVTGDVRTGTPAVSDARASIIDMGIMSMFKQMQDNSALQLTMVKDMMDARRSGTDWAPILAAVAPLVAAFITTLGSRKDPNEIAADLIDKLKPTSNGAADFVKMLQVMSHAREALGVGTSPNGEPADATSKAIEIFGPIVAKMLTKDETPTAAAAARATTRVDGSGGNVASLPSTTALDMTNMAPGIKALAPFVATLAQIAASGKDPYDFAHTAVEYVIPERLKGAVRELVRPGADGAAAQLVSTFPALAPYPTWLAEFADGVRQELCPELYADDEDDEVIGEGSSGLTESSEPSTEGGGHGAG